MLKVKENNEYKNVDLVYFGETEIEQVYDKNGNLVFDANNEIEDETPISFQGKKSANLKNYRIYGQTVDGESVGDLVTSGDHAGEYKVPVTVSNGTDTLTTPIYLPEQIKKVGDEAEYVDYETQKWHRVRKNLLQNAATSQTINGVTFTGNDDGSVTCDGTASKAIYFSFATNLESGTYIISGTPRGMTENNAVIFINANYSTIGLSNNVIDNNGNGKQFVATQSGTATLTITIKSGYTCDNLTFYPMIRLVSIEDDTYEPYIKNTEVDVILPGIAVTAGTNTLTVGTEIQPSRVEIKGRIKKL